jgi:prophage regulatory protein
VEPVDLEPLLREPDVLRLVPISRTTLWRWVRAGTFPKPQKLGPRTSAWRTSDVRRFLSERAA